MFFWEADICSLLAKEKHRHICQCRQREGSRSWRITSMRKNESAAHLEQRWKTLLQMIIGHNSSHPFLRLQLMGKKKNNRQIGLMLSCPSLTAYSIAGIDLGVSRLLATSCDFFVSAEHMNFAAFLNCLKWKRPEQLLYCKLVEAAGSIMEPRIAPRSAFDLLLHYPIQKRKRARWPSWKPAGSNILSYHVVFR